jgi:hypothetical protein
MEKCNNLDLAFHNEKTCNYLSRKDEFSDWVITTAFYSALHYVRHFILPYRHSTIDAGAVEFDDFESLFSSLRKDREGRHGFQNRMVNEKCSYFRFEYQKLYELSNNARYSNYKYEREDSVKAQTYLRKIKGYCIEPQKNKDD